MGKITIFALNTCPHCAKAKALLKSKGWPYVEISLTDYPEKRSDMLKLADRLTVPQIFFGEKHIGGASDLEALESSGQLDVLYEELKNAAESSNPLLQPPSWPPAEQPKVKDRTDEQISIGSTSITYEALMGILGSELDIRDRQYHLRSYRSCFLGTQLVDVLMRHFPLATREAAVAAGQQLQRMGLFDHVVRDHELKDEPLYYRLQRDEDPMVLNTRRLWTDRVDVPLVTVGACKKALDALLTAHRDSADGLVDYAAARDDPKFAAFEDMVAEIQKHSLGDMDATTTRLAYLINVYNLLVRHGFVRVGAPNSAWERGAFFQGVSYNIGGHVYSLSDIEHGILRGNQPPPFSWRRPFGENDPRREYALSLPVDPRIHFALNCGAKSCPPIKMYTAQAVQEELRIVAMASLEDDTNCRVDERGRTLWLTKLCQWYGADFGSSGDQVARTLLAWLRGEKAASLQRLLDSGGALRLRYFTYDWSNDAKPCSSTTRISCIIC